MQLRVIFINKPEQATKSISRRVFSSSLSNARLITVLEPVAANNLWRFFSYFKLSDSRFVVLYLIYVVTNFMHIFNYDTKTPFSFRIFRFIKIYNNASYYSVSSKGSNNQKLTLFEKSYSYYFYIFVIISSTVLNSNQKSNQERIQNNFRLRTFITMIDER